MTLKVALLQLNFLMVNGKGVYHTDSHFTTTPTWTTQFTPTQMFSILKTN